LSSKNTKIYAKYYILLEKCIKYFNDYQLELNKKYILFDGIDLDIYEELED